MDLEALLTAIHQSRPWLSLESRAPPRGELRADHELVGFHDSRLWEFTLIPPARGTLPEGAIYGGAWIRSWRKGKERSTIQPMLYLGTPSPDLVPILPYAEARSVLRVCGQASSTLVRSVQTPEGSKLVAAASSEGVVALLASSAWGNRVDGWRAPGARGLWKAPPLPMLVGTLNNVGLCLPLSRSSDAGGVLSAYAQLEAALPDLERAFTGQTLLEAPLDLLPPRLPIGRFIPPEVGVYCSNCGQVRSVRSMIRLPFGPRYNVACASCGHAIFANPPAPPGAPPYPEVLPPNAPRIVDGVLTRTP